MQTETTRHAPGTFCWIDLATTDAKAAKAFYAHVFGWSYSDRPIGDEFTYTTILLDGRRVGALFEKTGPQAELPPYWGGYVAVDDVDEVARKAEVLGGTIAMAPMDVMGEGRMAAVIDPVGGVVSMWQALKHGGLEVADRVGTLVWNELVTRDVPKATKFYRALFGWTTKTADLGGLSYSVMHNPATGRDAAGICDYPPEMGEMPSAWLVYFAVADTDAVVSKVVERGGQVVTPAADVAGVGRLAVLADPQGAIFGIVRIGS